VLCAAAINCSQIASNDIDICIDNAQQGGCG
jgi:hypothetical protein